MPSPRDELRAALRHSTLAKHEIFKAQDAANYVDGLRPVEDALRQLRSELEAFDRMCRTMLIEFGDEIVG